MMDAMEARSHPAFVSSSAAKFLEPNADVELVMLSGGARNGKVTAVPPGADYTETYPASGNGSRSAYHWGGMKDSSGMRVFRPGPMDHTKSEVPPVSPYIYACPACGSRDALDGARADCLLCHVYVLQIALVSSYIKGRDDALAALKAAKTGPGEEALLESLVSDFERLPLPSREQIQARVDPFI